MEIPVQFFAHLRDAAGMSSINLEVPAGATVDDLLAVIYARIPALRDWDNSILIGVGVEFVGRDHILQPNEPVAIMPPVQGG